jgi:hypothetical protein
VFLTTVVIILDKLFKDAAYLKLASPPAAAVSASQAPLMAASSSVATSSTGFELFIDNRIKQVLLLLLFYNWSLGDASVAAANQPPSEPRLSLTVSYLTSFFGFQLSRYFDCALKS